YDPIRGGNCTFAVAPAPAPVPCRGALPPNYNATSGKWDLEGNHTVQTPPFSLSLIGHYEIPTSIGSFDVNLTWKHSGDYYASADNGRGQLSPSSATNNRQKLIDVVNGSIGWTANHRNLEARLWARNITNERYWSYADEISFATFYSPASPLTYGVTITK